MFKSFSVSKNDINTDFIMNKNTINTGKRNASAMNTIKAISELLQKNRIKLIENWNKSALIIVENKMRMNKVQYIY